MLNKIVSETQLHLAKMFFAYREANKLSQTKVAKKLGVTFQQVQKYEKCINEMSALRLIDSAKIFKINLNDFIDKDPYQVLDGADISIIKKEKALLKIEQLEEKINDHNRSKKNMVGESISTRAYL